MNVPLVPKVRMNVEEFLERGTLETRIVNDGDIALDPPGLSVSVAALLG